MELIIFLIGLTILNIGILISIDWKDNWFRNSKNYDKVWDMQDLMSLDGFGFEDWCASIFKAAGYHVIQTPKTFDGGKDIILKKGNDVIYVECKRYTDEPIGRELCQKLVGSMAGDGIKHGLFITTSYFNQNANNYMCDLNKKGDLKLDFMDGYEILEFANKICSRDYALVKDGN